MAGRLAHGSIDLKVGGQRQLVKSDPFDLNSKQHILLKAVLFAVVHAKIGAIESARSVCATENHPLAQLTGVISKSELAKHVQLVLTDRSELTRGREFGVMSPLTWRLGDLFAKHSFLLKGLGWGGMPVHAVKQDLQDRKLVKLRIEDLPESGLALPMFAVYETARPPGPAGRWLIERLSECPSRSGTTV
jgi:DNA-binding transcriptional LysR family regulator